MIQVMQRHPRKTQNSNTSKQFCSARLQIHITKNKFSLGLSQSNFKSLPMCDNPWKKAHLYIYVKVIQGGFQHFALIFLKNLAICLYFETIQVRVPILKLNFLKIEFQCKTQFVENRVWGDQTLKKKKKKKKNLHVNRVHGARIP